jgi:hypothetical protein
MGNFGPLVLCLQVPLCCFLSSATRSSAACFAHNFHIRPHAAVSCLTSYQVTGQIKLICPLTLRLVDVPGKEYTAVPFTPLAPAPSLLTCAPPQILEVSLCVFVQQVTGSLKPLPLTSAHPSQTAALLSSLSYSMLLLSPPATARSVPAFFCTSHPLSHSRNA